mgnify:CR=1 FL=1
MAAVYQNSLGLAGVLGIVLDQSQLNLFLMLDNLSRHRSLMVKIQKNEFHNFAKNVDSKKSWTKISANFLAETDKELLWLTLLWQIQKF